MHIEGADSLEADSFINALRRFVCRRGLVREIRYDRGTNFIGAETELKKAIEEVDDQKIKAELLKAEIDWIKNPTPASIFGSVWERQIRSIKSVMNGLIREQGNRLDKETHATLGARVLVKVEQGMFAAVASKKQMDLAPKKFQDWRYCIVERKPVC